MAQDTEPEFQFHKGAIRTRIQAGQRAGVHQFQFHKGAIRTMKQIIKYKNREEISIP